MCLKENPLKFNFIHFSCNPMGNGGSFSVTWRFSFCPI